MSLAIVGATTAVAHREPTRLAEQRTQVLAYLASITRSRAEAEDLTQETMVRAWRGHRQLQDPVAEKAWLYRIATNVVLDRARARARRPVEVGEGDQLFGRMDPQALSDPSKAVERREMSACVQSLAAGLTEPQRAALLLHDGFGLSNPEIADVLGCSVAAVKIRLHRARSRMAELVQRSCALTGDSRGVLVCEPLEPRD